MDLLFIIHFPEILLWQNQSLNFSWVKTNQKFQFVSNWINKDTKSEKSNELNTLETQPETSVSHKKIKLFVFVSSFMFYLHHDSRIILNKESVKHEFIEKEFHRKSNGIFLCLYKVVGATSSNSMEKQLLLISVWRVNTKFMKDFALDMSHYEFKSVLS